MPTETDKRTEQLLESLPTIRFWRKVEVKFGRISRDFLGFGDYIAENSYGEWVIIQVTDKTNASKRRKKILVDCQEAAMAWLRGKNHCIELWAWSTRRDGLEMPPRVESINLNHFKDEETSK